jgi:hypothetical protein
MPFTQWRSQDYDKPLSQDFRVATENIRFYYFTGKHDSQFSCNEQGHLELRTSRNKATKTAAAELHWE